MPVTLMPGEKVQQEVTTPDGIRLHYIHNKQHGRNDLYWRTEINIHGNPARVTDLVREKLGFDSRSNFHGEPEEDQSDVFYKIRFTVEMNNGKHHMPLGIEFTNDSIRISSGRVSAESPDLIIKATLSKALVEATARLIKEDAKAELPSISH